MRIAACDRARGEIRPSPYMQARDHEDVICGRLLKCGYDVRVNEASISEQHSPQDDGALWLAREEVVEARQQISTCAREPLRNRRLRPANELEQFAAA